MTILGFIVVGIIAGFLARALVPGKDPMGILGTLVLGLVGSFVGGFLASALLNDDSISIIGATVGSIIVLLVYRAVTNRKEQRSTI